MDLSIIIVNWNATDYLRACLSSLYERTRDFSFETIVVDNGSLDGCETLIRDEFPSVVFVQSGQNLGFTRANNLGFSRSTGRILLFLNPDTEVVGGALDRMVAYLLAQPSAGAAGARLLNTDGSLQTSCVQALPTISNQLLDSELLRRAFPTWSVWGMSALFDGNVSPMEVEAISGACFMVKRNVFEQVGCFSEEYFMYADDLDLSWKIKNAGFGVFYLNGCEVVHHGGKSSAKQENHFADLAQREALQQFFRKRKGAFYSMLYRGSVAAIAALRLAVVFCLIPFGGGGLQGKMPSSVLRKWAKILGWALGFSAGPRAA